MNRRKRPSHAANHERWLVSYADFITLLFAFFVVLFSSAQVDKRKVGQLSMAMQEAFQQMGIFQTANSRTPLITNDPQQTERIEALQNARGISGRGKLPSPFNTMAGIEPPPSDLSGVQKQLGIALAPQIERHEVVLRPTREGLVISLREIGFFNSGSADVRATSRDAVRRIADVLKGLSNNVRIEGHTDDVPIHNSQFASNWELSTARATEMIRLFITVHKLPPTRLSAAGYAEFHPAAENTTAEGRAHNRRVDIVILTPAPERQNGLAP
jgi:chemotaxis protein MotB